MTQQAEAEQNIEAVARQYRKRKLQLLQDDDDDEEETVTAAHTIVTCKSCGRLTYRVRESHGNYCMRKKCPSHQHKRRKINTTRDPNHVPHKVLVNGAPRFMLPLNYVILTLVMW